MAQILWLASFPKSGNTWLRAFLANYLRNGNEPVAINNLSRFVAGDMRAEPYQQISGREANTLSWPEINRLRPQAQRLIAASQPGVVPVKTHSALATIDGIPTIAPEVTFGAIYVVRNPLDVVLSFADHYGLALPRAAQAICFKGLEIPPKPGHIRQVVSDWSTHVRGWLNAPGLHRKLLRYEDMSANPRAAFAEVVDFLRLPRDRKRLKNAVRFSDFREMSRQEQRSGFKEKSRNGERFFRRGRAGAWREQLPAELVALIVDHHREMMRELGYLTQEDEVVG